jgi:hypothetical protein
MGVYSQHGFLEFKVIVSFFKKNEKEGVNYEDILP